MRAPGYTPRLYIGPQLPLFDWHTVCHGMPKFLVLWPIHNLKKLWRLRINIIILVFNSSKDTIRFSLLAPLAFSSVGASGGSAGFPEAMLVRSNAIHVPSQTHVVLPVEVTGSATPVKSSSASSASPRRTLSRTWESEDKTLENVGK